jgi:hypothetical protein
MAISVTENRRGGMAMVGVGVKSSASQLASAAPTITSGAGAPSATEPNGSIYLRTDAANADQAIYARVAGSWVAIDGAP